MVAEKAEKTGQVQSGEFMEARMRNGQAIDRSGATPQIWAQGHRWLPYLLLILLVECCLTLHLLRQDPHGFVSGRLV